MQTPQIPANVLQLVLNETIDIATEQTGSTNLRGRCILINQISNEILLKLGYEVERRATRCDVRTDCGLFLLFGSGPASPGAIAWHAVSVHGHQWLYDFATAAYMDKPRVLVSERTFEERPHSINLRWVRQSWDCYVGSEGKWPSRYSIIPSVKPWRSADEPDWKVIVEAADYVLKQARGSVAA